MKWTSALAVFSAALLVGCGGGDQQQGSPERGNGAVNRPPEGFQGDPANRQEGFRTAERTGRPEDYEQAKAKAKADRESGADGYDYVHAHLYVDTPGPDSGRGGCTADWATNQQGFCTGRFTGGSEPFNNVGGETGWQRLGGGRAVPRDLMSIPGARESGILITQETDSGRRVECLIADRSSGDCVTKADQVGKPANTQGGPLYLDASFGRSPYVLLRGWCKEGDAHCTPH
jgi:hypothetical protein